MTPALRRSVAAVALATLVVLASCSSSSKAPSAGSEESGGSPTTASLGDGSCGSALPDPLEPPSWPLTITDDRDVEVTLDEPAARVVTLEWSYTEYVLALGLQPVGAADVANYATYVSEDPAIDPAVVDLGSRSQPSIETIRTLAPDLILTDTSRAAANVAELESIAPVLAFDTYGAGVDQLAKMLTSFRTVASALDLADEAEKVVDGFAMTLESTRERLEAADLETKELALVQGEGTVEAPLFRLFTETSMAWQIASHMCLENAVTDQSAGANGTPDDFGYVVVSMEGLTKLGDAWFLPVAPTAAVEEFEARFANNPLYEAMPFVVADRVRVLPEDTWFFGGPISGMLIAERIADALDS